MSIDCVAQSFVKHPRMEHAALRTGRTGVITGILKTIVHEWYVLMD